MKKGNVNLTKSSEKGYFLIVDNGITNNTLAITEQELKDILYLSAKELRKHDVVKTTNKEWINLTKKETKELKLWLKKKK